MSTISDAVVDDLTFDPDVDASGITVQDGDGDVVLTGSVPSYPQYVEAAAVASRVPGVKSVHNRLEVALPPGDFRDDPTLTAMANDTLTSGRTVAVTGRGDGEERRSHPQRGGARRRGAGRGRSHDRRPHRCPPGPE